MKRVLFFAPFGQFNVHHQLDAILAAALLARGHKAEVVGCNGLFETCDVLTWAENPAEACRNCAASSRRLFGGLQLPVLQLREFIAPSDFDRVRRWSRSLPVEEYSHAMFEGRPIGAWATPSVFSHFRITSASLHLPHIRRVHQGYLETAALACIALTRMLDQSPVEAMVVFNGRMAAYRVALELARERGIRVLGHERGLAPDSFTIYENGSCTEPLAIYDYMGQWRQVPLTEEECNDCTGVTRSSTGSNTNYPAFYTYSTDASETRQALNIPKDARIMGVFTSSEFELACSDYYKSVAYQVEFIQRLIEVFRARPNDYLVVRHHPNIAGSASVAADYDFLRRAWHQAQTAPPNVRVIMPSEKLSSYGLMPHLSAAVAFYSSTGVEARARGVASASTGDSYHHLASTCLITDPSLQGFEKLVDDLFAATRDFSVKDLRDCYRSVGALLRRHRTKLKSLQMKNFFEADIRVQDYKELLPGHDETLDVLCDFLLTGSPIFLSPTEEDLRRSTAAEDAFFEGEWQRVKASREVAPPTNEDAIATIPVAVLSRDESLPLWCVQSRHRAVTHHQVSSYAISELRARLAGVSERYVLIAGEGFAYDASLLRSAVKALEVDHSVPAIRFGAWCTREGGMIDRELFTPRQPCRDFHSACDVWPRLQDAGMALSFAVWRTEHLRERLTSLQTSEQCYEALHGEKVLEMLSPMAMIHPTSRPAISAAPCAPVLFMIFNRPDLTQIVFEAIREQRPRQLFIAADGARTQVPGERELCDATRRMVMERIDWDCEVKTLFRESNLGCKHAVASAISWFFEHVEEGIILEDDCLPEQDFFPFCTELLQRYRNDSSVMLIGGVNFQFGHRRGDASYYFSKYTHIWGWATWRRAWQLYDLEMRGLNDFLASEQMRRLCPLPAEAAHWKDIFNRVHDGRVDTWDYQWTYAVWKHGGLTILPQVNLISNLGFRADGTHTCVAGGKLAQMRTHPLGELVHATAVKVNDEADAFAWENIFAPAPAPAKAGKKPGKQRKKTERTEQELAAIKQSLGWKLVGKPAASIEKRLRRLLGSKE